MDAYERGLLVGLTQVLPRLGLTAGITQLQSALPFFKGREESFYEIMQ